ncbi:MAG TPA: OFA family MFS transporter [Bryobacteraceae bacterium]|nr:OFA family MFS transporter [Bryobacteraceae bacterium]
MATERLPNRWVIAGAAVIMQVCLGSYYSWSVFVKPLMTSEAWTLTQVSAAFTIAVVCLGIGSAIGGRWQVRTSAQVVGTTAGLFYGGGFLIAALAVANHSLWLLYAGYGLVGGLGMGMGYICPVPPITKWFPDKRGLMTGAAVMGFGGGALIMSPIAARLVQSRGVPVTLLGFGITWVIVIPLVVRLFKDPPPGWVPEGWQPVTRVAKAATTRDYVPAEAVKTWRFWLLGAMLSLNSAAGIMILSQASPLAQQQTGLGVVAAGTVVGIIAIFNAGGRMFWPWVSDTIGRAQVFFLLFAIQVGLFFALPSLHRPLLFTIGVCAIALCYGGGYGLMPSMTADFFGPKYVGGIFGWILLGWGFVAGPAPLLIAYVRQTTGTYEYAIYAIGFVMLFSLIFPVLARREALRIAAHEEAQRAAASVPSAA